MGTIHRWGLLADKYGRYERESTDRKTHRHCLGEHYQRNMPSNHAAGSVRHAEKRRNGTCEFANRIARASLDAYNTFIPQSYRERYKHTCIAAIVAHVYHPPTTTESGKNEDCLHDAKAHQESKRFQGHLQVMGFGVGTKFLPERVLREEQQNEVPYGNRVRDCHAEVLARRAFRRQLLAEILSDLHGKEFSAKNYTSILERTGPTQTNDAPNSQGENNCILSSANHETRYRLKSNVTLHFYASSAPCGNATLKRFSKMEKEKFDTTLGLNEWPIDIHLPIPAHSLRLGQFSLLVKKDGSDTRNHSSFTSMSSEKNNFHNSDSENSTLKGTADNQSLISKEEKTHQNRMKYWPCRTDDSWCPPSCSITNFNKGSIHSCSDKICRWNCLGLQGSLLMSILEKPIYMTTLTVGRKFSRTICQRAVCCRANGFQFSGFGMGDGESDDSSMNYYRLCHPVLLETNVYIDETGTHNMEGVEVIGQDASFDSNLGWVWWPEKLLNVEFEAECIDGKSGCLIHYNHSLEIKKSCDPTFSEVSTFSMFLLNLKILRMSSHLDCIPPDDEASQWRLEDMCLMKSKLSPKYEKVKNDFLRHRVFREWSCRYHCIE